MGLLDDYVDGPLCHRGCGVPVERVNKHHPNMKGPPYHTCPRVPWELARIAADLADAQLRNEYGDETVDEMRRWIEGSSWYGDKPRPYKWANDRPRRRSAKDLP
jgi:hypothetical protein